MGCDIHLVLEERNSKGKWVGLHNFPSYFNPLNREMGYWWPITSRNYELFAALAGVRGDGPEPWGVPCDASDLTLMLLEQWGADAHSETYYSLQDAIEIFVEHGEMKISDGHPIGDDAWYFYFGFRPDNPDDYRLVIWFDN